MDRVTAIAVVGALLVPVAPSLAHAQDVRVSVRIDVSQDLARAVTRVLDETLPAIRSDLREAIRGLASDLRDGAPAQALTGQGARLAARVEQTDRQHRTLSLGPSGSLDLSTLAGDITVTAGTGPPSLEIIRRSRARTDAEAKQGLDRVTVNVEDRNERVRVMTVSPENDGRTTADVEVSFVVTAPVGTNLTAHTLAGNVSVTGIHGEVGANTASGSVTLTDVRRIRDVHSLAGTVTISDAETDGLLEAHSIAGAVVMTRVKAQRVSAWSTVGQVTAEDVDCEEALLKSLSGTVEYRGLLARKGRYELRTQSGSVHFEPTGTAGFDLDARSFSGAIRIDPALHFQASGPPRRNLTGTGGRSLTGTAGNAEATVIIVTFSGGVTIGKR
jgi:hypothetical protein